MTAFHRRFVGATELPKSLTDLDVELSFRLSAQDIATVRSRFRTDGRLGAALLLVFIRATGRPLTRVASVPRALLQSLCSALGLNQTAIASLKTIYRRESTLYEHQKWAQESSGLVRTDEAALEGLAEALSELATTAASVDDLVTQAQLWLFDRKFFLPGDRVLRDIARGAFAAVEAAALAIVKKQIPAKVMATALAALHSMRRGRTGGTHLEWLKTAARKHGPRSLTEATEKISFLKSLGVDGWSLPGISTDRLRAYGQAVANRPPSDSKRLSENVQILEVACFLRVTLLELTDAAMYMAGRRASDFVRHATARVQSKQARSAVQYREREEEIRSVLYAKDKTAAQTVQAMKVILPEKDGVRSGSRAALVRESLSDDRVRIAALLNAFAGLEIKGDESELPLKQIQALQDIRQRGAKELPSDFDVSITNPVWHDLLKGTDRVRALGALQASIVMSVRQGLRGGRLWIDHSWEHRNREETLIPPDEWKANGKKLIRAMSLTADPKLFLERLRGYLDAGLQALSAAIKAGKLEIDSDGLVRLPALSPMDVEVEVGRSRDAMFKIIGEAQFCDMIVELDARVGFSEVLLGHRATTAQELIACYASLLAHGTENDAKGVAAMIPNMEVSRITAAMRALEAHGRLRRANERVVEFQRGHSISELWGKGDKASADMMSLEASRYLFNARVDPRRRTFAVGVYTHVMDAYGIMYDQPIVLNTRQAAAAVQGVEHHNAKGEEGLRLSLLAVDTHGYTNVAMAIAKLLGFDLCPRLRNLSERKLFLPRGMRVPENLERIAVTRVSESAVHKGWDELLRVVASIRSGRVSARQALERLGSAASGTAMHKAAENLGMLLRTLYLCDYFSNEEFRREIHTLLNRGESVHQLQRAIYFGRVAPERGRRRDEITAITGSHALLTNVVIAWNTMQMQGVVDRWRKEKHPIEDRWIARMGPVHFGNINFRGTMAFGIDRYADALLQKASATRARTA